MPETHFTIYTIFGKKRSVKFPKYNYRSEEQFFHFEFISEGPRGSVRKIVEYTLTSTENVYNLGFGDFNEVNQTIDDVTITNKKHF